MKIENTITVVNKLGLHARASAELVKLAGQYTSSIRLSLGTQSVDGKNIMGLMMLAAACGSEITLTIEGEDADKAAAEIRELFYNRFGEKE